MVCCPERVRGVRLWTLADEMSNVAGMLNEHGKERLLDACLRIAGADGSIDKAEIAEVNLAGVALGMSPAHIKGVTSHASIAVLGEGTTD